MKRSNEFVCGSHRVALAILRTGAVVTISSSVMFPFQDWLGRLGSNTDNAVNSRALYQRSYDPTGGGAWGLHPTAIAIRRPSCEHRAHPLRRAARASESRQLVRQPQPDLPVAAHV